jgi:exopolyphosphatase/guanosine-5'-triphosphate,3'-diphosphate pyrophosphatase
MVAVIDIGSNSIKVLVAARSADGRLVAKKLRTIEARISAGLSAAQPKLGAEGMSRGVAAVAELALDAQAFSPEKTIVVATSAVRDAANGAEFCAKVKEKTGLEVRILSGDEEAELIGRGLLCDALLAGEQDFYVFDLGGGSLECLAFQHRKVAQAASLPLGCVRLTEKFVPEPTAPFPAEAQTAIVAHVRAALSAAGFSLAVHAVAVGTGGTLTTVRAILAARDGKVLDAVSPLLTTVQLREMLQAVGSLPLAERKKIAGLPPGRADVFPAALATLIAVADLGGFEAYRHSVYNLRWGLAAEALK